jgi:23S rRNA pseudouridine955/2504/2580 synthase
MPLHEVQQIAVAAADDGVRLDRWLRRRWPELGQTQIHKRGWGKG